MALKPDADSSAVVPSQARPRLRVVVCTFGLSPTRGSEPATAWQHVSRIAQYHDVVALCFPGVKGEVKAECDKYFAEKGNLPGLTLEFVDAPPLSRIFEENNSKSILRAFISIGNRAWQKAALARVREMHAQQPFDAAHHLTITGYREPGYLWKLGVPFFWGPVTGASDVPMRYFGLMDWRDRIAYTGRNLANWVQMRFAPRPRKAARAAAHVWVVGKDNHDMVNGLWGVKCTELFETGTLMPKPDQAIRTFEPGQTLRLISSGLLVGRKALSIVLQALAMVGREFPWEYTIMGTGPAKEKWEAMGKSLGLGDRVRWTGNLPHAQALAEVQNKHVFLFPSLKEGTPNVVPEALSKAVPVICHDMCGMGHMVTDACGIRIPADGPEASARGFAAAIRKLATTPGEIERLSRGALERAAEITWDRNAQIMAEAYWQHSPKSNLDIQGKQSNTNNPGASA